MSITAIIVVAGIILIGLIGLSGRSREKGMTSWLVAGRGLPRWTSWFLQAGESLTTFSFLGLAGIAFTGGVSATFAVGYLSASAVGLFFVAPRLRNLSAERSYLTMADFFHDRFGSRTLSVVIAIVGAIFLIPYLQLQITGLGLIVELVTGSAGASGLSMVLASLIVVVFVIVAGIRGLARVSIFKDAGMLVGLVIVLVGVITAFNGIPEIFAEVAATNSSMLTTNAEGYGAIWWISGVAITTIGAAFNTMPHLWPPTLAAGSAKILRSNLKWLAVYQLLLFIPIMVGMGGIVLLDPATEGNRVLLTVAGQTMPSWLVAIVAVFGAAAAMVPAGSIVMGISSLVSNNVLYKVPEKLRFRLNHVVIVVAVGIALVFGLKGADIGALLLLTYGGLSQLAPAIACGLGTKVKMSAASLGSGIVVGTLLVAIIAFTEMPIGTWDSGFLALIPNLVVFGAVEVIVRMVRRGRRGGSRGDSASTAPDEIATGMV
ncbi:sodium:solute symporter family protein [Brevibacterium sp. FAM 27836]|uniref:sodium:solute symporter family protein n=1 Tax=Brevibacterium sp. FAM 27836 TaxID=3446693 RepID=UPI003F514080